MGLFSYLKDAFHTHRWNEKIEKGSLDRINFGIKQTIKGVVVLQTCEICGIQRAYFSDMNGIRDIVDLQYVKAYIFNKNDKGKKDE